MHTFGSSTNGNLSFTSNMILASLGSCWNGLTCQPAWGNMTVADMSLPLKALHFNAHHLACIYNTTDTANPTESAQYIAQYGKDGKLTGSRVETTLPWGNMTVSGTPWPDARRCCGNACESSSDPGFDAVRTNRTGSPAPARTQDTYLGALHLDLGQAVLGVPPIQSKPKASCPSNADSSRKSAASANKVKVKVTASGITAMPTATVTVTATVTTAVATATTIAQQAQIDAAVAAGIAKAKLEWQAQQSAQCGQVVSKTPSPPASTPSKTKKKNKKAGEAARALPSASATFSEQPKRNQTVVHAGNRTDAQLGGQAGTRPPLDPFRSKMTKRRR